MNSVTRSQHPSPDRRSTQGPGCGVDMVEWPATPRLMSCLHSPSHCGNIGKQLCRMDNNYSLIKSESFYMNKTQTLPMTSCNSYASFSFGQGTFSAMVDGVTEPALTLEPLTASHIEEVMLLQCPLSVTKSKSTQMGITYMYCRHIGYQSGCRPKISKNNIIVFYDLGINPFYNKTL